MHYALVPFSATKQRFLMAIIYKIRLLNFASCEIISSLKSLKKSIIAATSDYGRDS
jgi:hypothetical protein